MKIAAIIQARMGSSRLPGKVLREICGKPILQHVVERVSLCEGVDDILIATTDQAEDDAVREFAYRAGIDCVRLSRKLPDGSNDVLARFAVAASVSSAGAFMRVTADCPLWCPYLGAEVVLAYMEAPAECGYASNVHPQLDGFDTEVFSRYVLESAHETASDDYDRAHVTPWMRKHALSLYVDHVQYVGGLKLSVDTEEDFQRVRRIMEAQGGIPRHWCHTKEMASQAV